MIILSFFIVFDSNICKADYVLPFYMFKPLQERQNVCLVISDNTNRDYDKMRKFIKITKKENGEEKTLMDFTEFKNNDAFSYRTVCSVFSDKSYCKNHPKACIDCDGNGTLECPGSCFIVYLYMASDTCAEPIKSSYKLSYKIESNGILLKEEEGSYYKIEVKDSGYSCKDSQKGACESIESLFDDNEQNGDDDISLTKKQITKKDNNDDSSCGCTFLSTDDPAGVLPATMLLFAFFALAFERIRRKK